MKKVGGNFSGRPSQALLDSVHVRKLERDRDKEDGQHCPYIALFFSLRSLSDCIFFPSASVATGRIIFGAYHDAAVSRESRLRIFLYFAPPLLNPLYGAADL